MRNTKERNMRTATEAKQWTIGKYKTAVTLWWDPENNVVVSSTAVPVSELTVKQYNDQTERIKKSIKSILGWDAESNGGHDEDTEGCEQCGWVNIH